MKYEQTLNGLIVLLAIGLLTIFLTTAFIITAIEMEAHGFSENDYCSAFNYNGTDLVEYCILFDHGIQCNEHEIQQLLCQVLNDQLERIGQ